MDTTRAPDAARVCHAVVTDENKAFVPLSQVRQNGSALEPFTIGDEWLVLGLAEWCRGHGMAMRAAELEAIVVRMERERRGATDVFPWRLLDAGRIGSAWNHALRHGWEVGDVNRTLRRIILRATGVVFELVGVPRVVEG